MWTEITRRQYERLGLRYASDLTDEEWQLIARHLPPSKRLGRPRTTELREVLNAILYMARKDVCMTGVAGGRQITIHTASNRMEMLFGLPA